MRIAVFLFAAITAALTLPALGRSRRMEETPQEPETEQTGSAAARRAAYHEGYGFAPTFEPDARAWKRQWKFDRRRQRAWAQQEANTSYGTSNRSKESPQKQGGDELPPYWSFAEPAFSPPWLSKPAPASVDLLW